MGQQRNPATLWGYLPTLDGWRALSIVLVLFHHTRRDYLHGRGVYGVYVFFAISGVLICGRLLDEEESRGKISLRSFYLRRAFRILPATIPYLFVLAVMAPQLHVDRLHWFSALLFFRNYTPNVAAVDWYTGHFWSLAIEEHFYLLLPGIMVFFPKLRGWILVVLIVWVDVWRHLSMRGVHLEVSWTTFRTLDALLIPALIALLAKQTAFGGFLRRWLRPWSPAVLIALGLLTVFVTFPQMYLVQRTILPLMILSTCWNPDTFIGRFLEWKVLRWIGRLSYSLYIWQQFFFYGVPGPYGIGVIQSFPVNLGLAIGAACLSYYVIERPMIRLGHRVASSGVPGRNVDKPSLLDQAEEERKSADVSDVL